jgi:hypothetical protein
MASTLLAMMLLNLAQMRCVDNKDLFDDRIKSIFIEQKLSIALVFFFDFIKNADKGNAQ